MVQFSVNLCDSHPEKTNERLTGQEFDTLEQARLAADNWIEHFNTSDMPGYYCPQSVKYVEIDGPDTYIVRHVGAKVKKTDNWRRERAMQAGMLGGTRAFNDAMGY